MKRVDCLNLVILIEGVDFILGIAGDIFYLTRVGLLFAYQITEEEAMDLLSVNEMCTDGAIINQYPEMPDRYVLGQILEAESSEENEYTDVFAHVIVDRDNGDFRLILPKMIWVDTEDLD